MFLINRWREDWAAIGAQGFVDAAFRPVNHAYSSEKRHYHSLRHLEECFGEYDLVLDRLLRPRVVAFAIWYHDYVYWVDKPGSEAASAEFAMKILGEARVPKDLCDLVGSYIRATAAHTLPTDDTDLRYFLDIDLSILGQSKARFDEYEEQIRKEYDWVPPEIYRFERAKILKKFLEGPIYKTPFFKDRYEMQARENLARSIATLTMP